MIGLHVQIEKFSSQILTIRHNNKKLLVSCKQCYFDSAIPWSQQCSYSANMDISCTMLNIVTAECLLSLYCSIPKPNNTTTIVFNQINSKHQLLAYTPD